MTPRVRLWIGASCAAAAFWGVVILAEVPVEVGEAKLPTFDEVEQAVDERVGEKRIDDAESEVDARFTKEKESFEQDFGGVVSDLGSAGSGDVVSSGQERAITYQEELAQRARAEVTTEFLDDGYLEMLKEHTNTLYGIELLKLSNNEFMMDIYEYNRIYEKQKFMIAK